MNINLTQNHTFNRMLVNLLSIFVILAIAFPATGRALAQDEPPPAPTPWRDEFDGVLADDWYWVNENPEKWSINDGLLRIYASPYEVDGPQANKLMRNVTQHDFTIETHVFFEPQANFQFAGLTIFQDDDNALSLGRAFCDTPDFCVGNGIHFDYFQGGNWNNNFATTVDNSTEAYLRLERRGDMVRAFYSSEGITWFEIGTHWIPPDFQVNGVGLMAIGDYDKSDEDIPADFDYFEMTEGWGFLPEGFHDYDQGDVPSWACNAGGWAADPDDRATDLAIEVNVDGTALPDGLYASEYREDLDTAGVCVDGNCSFHTSLWNQISSYEPHSIVVYAQDVPSGEWVQLSNSPKSLTCRSYDIYAYDPLTGTTKLITSNLPDADEYDPTWSQNGRQVAHDVVTSDSHRIYITDVRTGVSTVLHGTEDGGNDAAWSPNGKWIAFDRRWFGEPNIYIVPATGGDRTLVRENAVSANWAPNGKRIVFQDDTDGSIRTVPVDGSVGGETLITEFGSIPAWSPDGNWIAYSRDGNIWKVQVNVQGRVRGEPIQLTSNPFNDGKPTWSPDSQTIIYDSGFGQDNDLWSIPAAGGTPTWLTGAPVFGDYSAANARNSSTVAYASFSPEGQAARTWASAYTHDAGTWSLGGHNYRFEATWNGGGETTDEVFFNVSEEAQLYARYALLRPGAVRVGADCSTIDTISPEQETRFLAGYVTDSPMTYADAQAHFEIVSANAVWDDGQSAELEGHEIIPFNEGDWFNYACTFTEAPPKMDLRVNYGHDWIESFYEGGHAVSIQVTDGEGNLKATAEVVTEPKDFWGGQTGFQTTPENWVPAPPDLQPYDWVYAQVDNGATSKVQLGDIGGMIDLDANSVAGTILAPWITERVQVECLDWGSGREPPFDTIQGGSILTDGSESYSCSWSEWDIQYYQHVGVGYFSPDGHWVANALFVLNPHFTVFPEWEWFDGLDWPDGATVNISVEGKPECATSRESSGYFFNGSFGDGCDVAVGDVVTFTDGDTVRTHTVRNLAITMVDKTDDTVSGTADVGETVYVWPHATGQQLQATVGASGTWQVDFTDVFDLVEGTDGRSEIRDEAGNSTAVDWRIPNPHFSVFPEWEYVEGWDWPDGALVSASIDGKDACIVEGYSGHPDWDPNALFVPLGFPEGCDVVVGDVVTLTDGTTIRTYTVQNLAVTLVDKDANTITGTADPGAIVHVWPHGYNELLPTTDANGVWLAEFNSIGVDLVEDMGGRTEIRDALGNATAVEWYIPPPSRIVVQITDDWFRAENFTPNGQLTFWIYDAEGEQLLSHPDTTWQLDGSGFVTVGMWELEEFIDLVPGNYLIVSDGTFTRELVLEAFTFDIFDTTNGHLAGTAPEPFGRSVWVGIGFQDNFWTLDVTTDSSGNWVAEFGAPVPSDYQWVAAQIFDADGDASELRPAAVINPTLVIANQPDWVDSGISVSAGESFTIEAFGLMNPCSDTYPNGADYCIFYTPLGAEGVVPYENEFGIFPGPGLRFMALLGRIGDGEPFYVGAGGTFTAEQSGTLWFTPNDNLRTDNQGAYSVLVRLEP